LQGDGGHHHDDHRPTGLTEALTNVYTLDVDGRLDGVASLGRLLQADTAIAVGAVAESHPVRVFPHADLIEVATVMADYNLIALPVVDKHDQIIGIITVDDVLEAVIPPNWRRCVPAPVHDHSEP
jgi:Mg/Co/Ni transporter MgtE